MLRTNLLRSAFGLFLCTLMLCQPPLKAQRIHNTGITQTQRPTTITGYKVFPPNQNSWLNTYYSWHHWYESNQHRFYKLRNTFTPSPQWNANREQAAALLRELLDHPNDRIRADAALALGRIKDTQSINQLNALILQGNAHPVTKRNAYLALAMMDQPPQEIAHPKNHKPKLDERLAILFATALLPAPDNKDIQYAFSVMSEKTPQDLLAASWFMRHVTSRKSASLSAKILYAAKDPQVTADAVYNYAFFSIKSDQPVLYHILLGHVMTENPIPVITRIDQLFNRSNTNNDLPNQITNLLRAQHASIKTAAAMGYRYQRDAKHYTDTARRQLRDLYNNQTIYIPYQKFSSIDDDLNPPPIVGNTTGSSKIKYTGGDLLWLHNYPYIENVFSAGYELRFLLPSLAQMGEHADARIIRKILKMEDVYFAESFQHMFHDPNRGFAAMALALYLRRIEAAESAGKYILNAELDKQLATEIFRNIITNPDEPAQIRAACVTAMGISDNPAFTADLRKLARIERNRFVLACTARSLALLGEGTPAAELAIRLMEADPKLTPPAKPDYNLTSLENGQFRLTYSPLTPKSLLTARTLAEAILISGEQKYAPRLARFLHVDPYLDQRIIPALKALKYNWNNKPTFLNNARNFAKQSIKNQETINNYGDVAFEGTVLTPIWQLGEIFSPTINSPLAAALRMENFTVFNGTKILASNRTRPVLSLVNLSAPFMYEQLLAQPVNTFVLGEKKRIKIVTKYKRNGKTQYAPFPVTNTKTLWR